MMGIKERAFSPLPPVSLEDLVPPDHSSLTRIRERYGLAVFRRFFETITEQCLAAELVWGRELYFDATKVPANAGLDSVGPRSAVEAHLATLFASSEQGESDTAAGQGRCRCPCRSS